MSVSAIQAVGSDSYGGRSSSLAAAAQSAPTAGTNRRTLETLRALGRPADPHDPAVIRQTASQMVSELFVVPMLGEMREFPFGKEIGNGGQAEEAFGAQLDQRIADAVTNAQRGGLVDQLARRLERKTAVAGDSKSSTNQTGQSASPLTASFSWLTQLQSNGAGVNTR